MVTVRSALSDDGSPRALTVAGANVALTQPHTGSNGNGNTTIQSYGTLAISNLDQIFGGNLNLSTNGTLMLDGIDWATFTAARSYGTGAGQWQLNGGGFAARSAELLIATNPTGFTWDNRNFTLGTTALLNGVVYGDAGVEIAVPISLGSSATTPRTLLLLGRNIESTTNWTLRGPVHELSGQLSGTVQSLTLQGRGYHLPESLGGTLRISNPANDFVGSVIVQGGGAVGIFTSDGAFGDAANPVKSTDVGGGTAGGMILLEDANSSGPTTFSRALSIEVAHGGGGKSGFGSYAGDTIYTGTVTLTETGVFPGTVPFHVADGTMTLGTAGTPATLANNRTNAAQYNKGGAGELILGDVGYSTGSNPNYTWVLRQGTLTTTQDPATVGTNGGQLASGFLALDNVLYTSGSVWPTWRVATNDQTYSTNGASGHFGFNNLDVEDGRTLTINMGNGILGAGDGATLWLLHKQGAGTWVYTTTNTGGSYGGSGFIQVDEGTLDIRGGGSMGPGVSLRLSGGELYVSGAGNRFSASSIFEIDADGGKLGLSPAATADVGRAGVIAWTQGLPPVSFAARDNYNLNFTNLDFPDVNAGTTLLIERDGSGTGEVRIYDTAVAVNGTIGGSGRLQMGSAATGTLTVNGFLAPGTSPGTLTIDGNLVMGDGAVYLWEIEPGPGGPADHLTDLAVVTGDLTLGGGMAVNIILNGDIDADPAREYDLFRYGGSLTGWNPSAITLDYALAGRLTGATVNLDADGGRIYLTGLVEIPEPATLGMLLAGILVLARRRARRT